MYPGNVKKNTEKITIPPNWKSAVLLGSVALFFFLAEFFFGPLGSLSHTLHPYFLSTVRCLSTLQITVVTLLV